MRTIWQECPRDDRFPQWSMLYVTMNRKGEIVMNRTTYEATGSPAAYLIYFDEVNNRIGLKPTHSVNKKAFPAAPNGRHGGKKVRAFRLMPKFGLVISETVQFHDAAFDDGMLILDMRSAKVSTRAMSQRKRVGNKGN